MERFRRNRKDVSLFRYIIAIGDRIGNVLVLIFEDECASVMQSRAYSRNGSISNL